MAEEKKGKVFRLEFEGGLKLNKIDGYQVTFDMVGVKGMKSGARLSFERSLFPEIELTEQTLKGLINGKITIANK